MHPIIYQDPSAKPAEPFGVMYRPSTLPLVEANVDVPRVKPDCVQSVIFFTTSLVAPTSVFLVELVFFSLAPPPPI